MSTPTHDDDSELRLLLGDAVSDVHPHHGTRQIRDRARRPAGGRRMPITLAAAVATVTVIGGAAWLAQRQPVEQRAAGPGSGTVRTTAALRTAEVPAYFVGATAAGPRLFTETHRVTGTTASDLQLAVDETLAGRPHDPDYRAAWLYPGTTARATASRQVISIELALPADAGTIGVAGDRQAAEQRALQALVWAADSATGTDLPVRFTLAGGSPQQVFRTDLGRPVARASGDSVLSTISVTTPNEGATVPSRFEVTGRAATFEANVVWELKQGGRTVQHGFTTAAECCTLAPYTFTVSAAPGDYTLVVHDVDESDGEGIGTSSDSKRITVQ